MSNISFNNNESNFFPNFNNVNSVNNVNMFNSNDNNNNNCIGYVPYSQNCPINFFQFNQNQMLLYNNNNNITQNKNIIQYNNNIPNDNINANNIVNPFNNNFNINNQNNKINMNSIINNNNNNIKKKKIETDSDLIQGLSGNYLNGPDDTYSEEKIDKKEIEINLGQIVVNDLVLNDFPIIELNNPSKYNFFISENILNNDDFFTAIKQEKEESKDEMNIEEDEKEKIIIQDNDIININENIFNNLKELLNNDKIKLYANIKQLMIKKVIELLYDKCLTLIMDIKRNIKNRVKKVKSFEISNVLQNAFKLHNELYNKYLVSINKNPIQNDSKEYFTYVQDYLKNSNGKTYKCEICLKEFINFHKLGGHMSKMHPNCSEKYKKQNDIRKQREGKRNVLDDVKEKLFQRYNLDYRKMKKNDEKEKIKSFIKSHQKEYEILRRKIHRENALKNDE